MEMNSKREDRRIKLNAILEQSWWRYTKSGIKHTLKFIWDGKFWLIFALCLFSFYKLYVYSGDEYKMDKCGKIIDMKQLTDPKNRTVTNLLYIRYGQEIEQREVQDKTYYNHKKGDYICFAITKPEYDVTLAFFTFLLFATGIITIIKIISIFN
jgi:hypothetical protein